MTDMRTSSMMARRPRAPVWRRMAWSAMASRASRSKSSSTPSSSNRRWYCFTRALRGSTRIWSRASRSRLWTEVMTGRRPMNSGIMPNLTRSSGMTSATWSLASCCRLDQLEQDVLDVLADVPGLRQRRRVRDRERDVEHAGQGLGEQRLARAGRAEQEDVGLRQLDRVVTAAAAAVLAGLDALVVVVD